MAQVSVTLLSDVSVGCSMVSNVARACQVALAALIARVRLGRWAHACGDVPRTLAARFGARVHACHVTPNIAVITAAYLPLSTV